MSAPLVLAPLRIEAAAARIARPRPEVSRIGMGPAAATATRARLERELADARPLVLIGFAGALDATLRAGELVVASGVASLGTGDVQSLPVASSASALLRTAGVPHRVGELVSAPRLLRGAKDREMAGMSGALACDMETFWLAPLARRHPFIVVRAVVDTVSHDVVSVSTPLAAWRAFRSLVRAVRAFTCGTATTLDTYPLVEAGES